jgi:hypothetical protein
MLTGTQGVALAVQRAGLSMLLGRLGSAQIHGQPNTRPAKYIAFACRSGMQLRSRPD